MRYVYITHSADGRLKNLSIWTDREKFKQHYAALLMESGYTPEELKRYNIPSLEEFEERLDHGHLIELMDTEFEKRETMRDYFNEEIM